MQGERTTRMPRGFAADHPAAEVLRHKQFLAAREEPAAFAAQPDFYAQLVATFAAMAPFVLFLNAPIVAMRRAAERDPLVADRARGERRRRA
jgi:uncharacterized protein (DUF2461 family)